MTNKLKYFFIFLFITIIFINHSDASEEFTFDITEIDITQNGNLIIGSKGGKAETEDGYEIIAENFVYNKLNNILKASGKVKLINKNNALIIFADKATYLKNDEIVFTEGNSKAVDENYTLLGSNFEFDKIKNILVAEENVKFTDNEKNTVIFSDKATYLKNDEIVFTEGNSKAVDENYTLLGSNFEFDKIKNILVAEENVKFTDNEKNTVIFSDKATYLKNDEIVFTEGYTSAFIENEYYFKSKNVKYLKKENQLSSNDKSSVEDNEGNIYNVDNFLYNIENRILKAKNLNIFAKVDNNKNDNYRFSNGFFNLESKSFVAEKTNIKVHKDVFGDDEQDPRIYGVSSYGDEKKTIINKGIFTSCKFNDNCPPWSIQAKKITHDKVKQDLIYDNAILKIYDFPVFYLPKFMHPDPTVERRTGFLQPQLNRSKTLGDSIYLPYFKTLGPDKDYTFKPTIFDDKKKIIFQNEFRKKNKNSSLIADFSLMTGYKPSSSEKRKRTNHLFVNFQKDLNLPNFLKSDLDLKIEKVNNDTYLKVFEHNLFPSPVLPKNKNTMQTSLNYDFEHEEYNFSTGLQIYENLGVKHSDRYQYVLPSYNFSKNLELEKINGSVNFYSSGSNNLKNTNNLTTSITNDISYNSIDYLVGNGLKNNLNLYVKNLNSVGKNDSNYTSSPSIDGMTIFEIYSSLPLIKVNDLSDEILTPKISLRANPVNNMIDHSSSNKIITANNAFSINRLGISDSFEAGKSLTLGLDYKIEYKNEDLDENKDKFLEFKLATVIRDKVEKNIPISSTIDKKNSNLFGSIQNNLFENINIGYDFSIDNDFKTFESHSLSTEISINNFVTNFYYTEQRAELGSSHIISNTTTYNLDDNNSFLFSTRRNKAISLTEYYDLAYQYKNDCLTAAIKYNRTFYEDNDLVPSENLFLTVTLIPLTTYERRLYERDKYGNYNFGE